MYSTKNHRIKQIQPLSWFEARLEVRDVLEKYVRDPPALRWRNDRLEIEPTNLFSSLQNLDLDLYAGSILFSLILLIISSLFFVSKSDRSGNLNSDPQANHGVYKSQLCAATMLLCASILSLWMVRRRRFLCLNDSDTAKRREILKFLRVLPKDTDGTSVAAFSEKTSVDLSGTALTDLYPVYRKIIATESSSWSRIPSLLLARGDFIALQIGDYVPANCISVNKVNSSGEYLTVRMGDRLSLASIDQRAEDIIDSLPKGRTTLKQNSEYFLPLCNSLELFRVVDTPLEEFIRREPVATRPSQISRKLKDIRLFLLMFVLPFVLLTALALFARPKGSSADITLVAPLPILAALGILPVVGPFCVIVLEVIGTARILATVHPYASMAGDKDSPASDGSGENLVLRYMFSTVLSRLSLWEVFEKLNRMFHSISPVGLSLKRPKLIRIPPASLNVLDVLGLATALALVDDELACEPHSIPQQLLIPSGRGLKLLDLCPEHENSTDDDNFSDDANARKRGKSFDSDLDSDESKERLHGSLLRRKFLRGSSTKRQKESSSSHDSYLAGQFDVQFEEPNWWQHLPSLKCIGLACLLADGKPNAEIGIGADRKKKEKLAENEHGKNAKSSLVKLVCSQRSSLQFRSLAECIGFSTEPNASGARGDISPFTEVLRMHALSVSLFKQRLLLDAHERSSEQARWWGLIRPDSTSVVVKDDRTQAYQLLTVGDPAIVTNLCNEAWQGEISTILPLAAHDKQTIIETTNNWKLGDLDVTAFCYSPVPHNVENNLISGDERQIYLLDNSGPSPPLLKDKSISTEWSIIRNQIFLGVLGSLVVPRREIQKLLDILSDAGIRFVYFSPRNMRRQKELAIQMGIDVAWNCAISLRALESGEEDPHRMVSAYADWDVKARLPHGVEDVRKHLMEVDNVPLLVSLFTDVTKKTTQEMVEIFQEYHDTVISIGLSHLPTNDRIFAASDIAVGIDVLTVNDTEQSSGNSQTSGAGVLPCELEFVSSIAAHSCAFRFRGAKSVSNISTIVEKGRASLEAAIAAGTFFVTGSISFSFYVLFSVCMPFSSMTYIPMIGAVIYLQIILPGIALVIAFSDGDKGIMKRVPPKNDRSIVFGKKEGYVFYSRIILKALFPAVLPQLLNPMVFGGLLLRSEPDLVSSICPGSITWIDIIRCDAIKDYTGFQRTAAGCWIFVQFVLCISGSSVGFVHLCRQVWESPPWKSNHFWVISILVSACLIVLFAILFTGGGAASALPGYYYVLALIFPVACAIWVEVCKRSEIRLENRAEKIRRLQFETRLGAWSPR